MLPMQKNLTRPFFALMALPATAMGFALSVQIAALSWLLRTKFDLEIDEIGLVWAAGPIAGILGQVLIGIVSDRVWFWGGRRRPFILIGGLLSALSLLALPNIGVISASLGFDGVIAVALTVALLLDLSINVSFNPTRSIIADLTPAGALRTRGYTWMQTVSGTFGVLAYAMGATFGNTVLIYAGAALVLVFSVLPTLFLEEPRALAEGGRPGGQGASSDLSAILSATRPLWAVFAYDLYALGRRLAGVEPNGFGAELLCLVATAGLIGHMLMTDGRVRGPAEASHHEFRKIMAAHAFSWIGVQTMFVYFFAFAEYRFAGLDDAGLGQTVALSFLVLNGVAALLPALVLGPMTLRQRRVFVHAASLAVMSAGYLCGYLFGGTPAAIYAVMGLLGVGWAAIVSLPFAIMSVRIDETRMGLYMGLFNLSVVLPQLFVSMGVAVAVQQMADKGEVFLIGAGSLAVSAALWTFVKRAEAAPTEVPLAASTAH